MYLFNKSSLELHIEERINVYYAFSLQRKDENLTGIRNGWICQNNCINLYRSPWLFELGEV